MKIETKYNIGQHIWVVYENRGEICIYDDYIGWISYEEKLQYGTRETCNDLNEEDIVLYDETDKLVSKIKDMMDKIRERENNAK